MENKRYVISDQPSGDAPRLMLIFGQPLSPSVHANLRECLSRDMEFSRTLVFDFAVEIYQLVNGRWIHLDGSVELEGAPIPPTKVNFREFT